MTQVKMGVGNVIFSNFGAHEGSICLLYDLIHILYVFFYFQYYDFLVIQPHIVEIIMLSG